MGAIWCQDYVRQYLCYTLSREKSNQANCSVESRLTHCDCAHLVHSHIYSQVGIENYGFQLCKWIHDILTLYVTRFSWRYREIC